MATAPPRESRLRRAIRLDPYRLRNYLRLVQDDSSGRDGARAQRQIGQGSVSESNQNRAPRLPDFIAVGPPRTATTWLHEVLQGHVCLPADRKETDFFTRFYDRGLDWYADYFRHCEGGIPVGELSPMYFASPPARERIARHLPECKIIVSLRDPVERAYSNYRMLRRIVATKVDFEDCRDDAGRSARIESLRNSSGGVVRRLRPRAGAGSDLR